MQTSGLASNRSLPSVVKCALDTAKNYAFIEFRTIDEAASVLTYLNGLHTGSTQLKIGRPKNYIPPPTGTIVAPPMPAGLGSLLPGAGTPGLLLSQGVGGAPPPSLFLPMPPPIELPATCVVMVSNFPIGLDEEQMRELVTTFGPLNAFNCISNAAGASTKTAVFEYTTVTAADDAVTGLPLLALGSGRLSVQRVPVATARLLLTRNSSSSSAAAASSSAPPMPDESELLGQVEPSAVLRLSNLTTAEDLLEDDLFSDLHDDIQDLCNKTGCVRSIVVPRGSAFSGNVLGQVYVQFANTDGAAKTKAAVHNKCFLEGRPAKAFFFPEELFVAKEYSLPIGYIEAARQKKMDESRDLD